MTIDELRNTALNLPLLPGVYIMKDQNDDVIYVGKAKELKNRVTQYFRNLSAHSPKTRQMVCNVDHFDVIVARSEFEALVLECSLIKQHKPKYNILLKDDKGYPFIRLDIQEAYPKISLATTIEKDGAEYFGPFGNRGVTNGLIETITHTLKLPDCSKKFPRDINKGRPCLNYHLNLCSGWCQKDRSKAEYRAVIDQARQLLLGNYKAVAHNIRNNMLSAAENMQFELAAEYRNQLNAVEALGLNQLVNIGMSIDTDVIGYAQTEAKACFTVLHFKDGKLVDKDFEIFSVPDDQTAAVSSLIKQFYLRRRSAPKRILLPFEIEDAALFTELLLQDYKIKTRITVPKRGENVRFIEMATQNAQEEAERVTEQEERRAAQIVLLGKSLNIAPPKRIESFDVSNISGTDIVAAMVVFLDGKPRKSEYKHFKIKDLTEQDDYASMYQTVYRRFSHYINNDTGFNCLPDLLLIDGGVNHAVIACRALDELGIHIQVFGMVKDDRHRTRALVTPGGDEIRIDHQPSLFALIGNIQEETHRFAITYHRKLRSKRLRYSVLDEIPGVGKKRKELLIRKFKSIRGIASANLQDLKQHLPADAALSVYQYFHNGEEGRDKDAGNQR